MIRFAIEHAHLVVVTLLVVALLGAASAAQMEVDVFPDLHQPAVQVAVNYNGMPAKDMEASITRRLERMFIQAGGIDHMESRSITGMGIITIYFKPTVDVNAAISQVIALAIADLSRLPPGTLPPLVVNYDVSGLPVCMITLSSEKRSQSELYDVANYTIREQLGNVEGVAAPPVYGGLIRQVQVYVDPEKLIPLGLSPLDVVNAVGKSNLIIPTGVAKIGKLSYDVISNAEFDRPRSFNDVPIATRQGRTIFVRDVGEARDANAIVTNIVRVDGKRSVYIPIQKQTGANTIKVVDAVKEAARRFRGVPDDVKLDVVFDQSIYVRDAVKQLAREGVLGAVLAGLCVLLFLASFRSTFAIVLAIPAALLAALLGLFLGGETLNLMTLGGLALAVGRVIDDAVVVIENTMRHLGAKDAEPAKAAEEAAREVAVPVLASTITTIIVFLPVVYLTGVAKYLFTPLAISVALAMAASYVFAMTFIPFFAAHVLGPEAHDEKKSWFIRKFDSLKGWYGRRLERALAHRRILFTVVGAVLLGSLAFIPFTGYEFFPNVDAGTFTLHVRAQSGMRVEELETRVASEIEAAIKTTAPEGEVQRIVTNLGISPDPFATMNSKNSAEHEGFIQVKLVRDHSMPTDELVAELRRKLPHVVPGVDFLFQTGGITTAAINFGRIAPIDVQILDEDLEEAHDLGVRVKSEIERVRGIVDPLLNVRLDYPTLNLEVDRWKAAELGLTEEDVVKNVITSLSSSNFIHPIVWVDPESGNDYYAAVQYSERTIDSLENLRNIPVTGAGEKRFVSTLLRNIAPIRREQSMVQATHYNILRTQDVFAGVAGRDLGSTATEVEPRLARLELPKDAELHVRGAIQTLRESFRSFAYAVVLALALIYLVLVAQLRSLVTPLVIMAAIPLASTGVFAILPLTHVTYNIQTFLGILMLLGIVVSNSVLLVEFADRSLEQGKAPLEAAIAAGETRLRPILMTALATVFAMLPLALGLETGSEANVPLARAVIGGLLASTLLTLFVVPALWASAAERRVRRGHGGGGEPTARRS
jgi:multidrug efflux pump subunit AcrB